MNNETIATIAKECLAEEDGKYVDMGTYGLLDEIYDRVWLFWNNGSEAGYDVIPQCASRASVVEMEHHTHLFPPRSFGDASLCCRLGLDQGRRLCPRPRALRAPHRAIALAGGPPDDPQ